MLSTRCQAGEYIKEAAGSNLARAEDAKQVGGVVAVVALVDVDSLDLAPGERLGSLDDGSKHVPIVRGAVERLSMEDELAALAPFIDRGDRHFAAELVGRANVSLADVLDLRRVT